MNKHTTNPRIIIDKSYIQGMPKDGGPFHAMIKQDCHIVLVDTLLYELCSTKNSAQWPASKRKLAACPLYAIELWEHVSGMLEVELGQNRPYGDPLRCEKTKSMQQMLANNPQWQPTDLKAIIEEEGQKREGKDIIDLLKAVADSEPLDEEIAEEIKNKKGGDEKVVQCCYNYINNPENIRSEMQSSGLIQNPNEVDENWVIWHLYKSLFAVHFDRQRRNSPFGKSLANTKHDLDYLISLAFADAIASCEITGEMSYYRRWMFGDNSKPLISSYEKSEIDSVMKKLK